MSVPRVADDSALPDSSAGVSRSAIGTAGAFSRQLLEAIRKRFHFPKGVPAFLDSASGTLRLKAAVDTLAESSRWPNSKFGTDAVPSTEVVSRGTADARVFLGAPSAVIMPALSATHAVYRALNAVLRQASGTNIVTTNLEHPAVYDSTHTLADVYGRKRRVAGVDPATGRVPPEAVLELVDRGTDALAFVHGSNVTGAVADVAALAAEARRLNPDIFLIVDGVQYSSHHSIRFDYLGIDAYVFSPYKVFSVKGLGFAALSDRLARLPHWSLRGYEPTNWNLGNPDDPSYAAWSTVLEYLDWLGSNFSDSASRQERVAAAMTASGNHTSHLLDLLVNGLPGVPGLRAIEGVRLHAMDDGTRDRLGIALFELDGIGADMAVDEYLRQGVALSTRKRNAYARHILEGLGVQETIRVSTCHYTTPYEVEHFLRVTASLTSDIR